MGMSIVVSASQDILAIVKPLLNEKSRDEAFSMPFAYGPILYYLPDLAHIDPLNQPNGFTYAIVEQDDIPALYQFEGFRGALIHTVTFGESHTYLAEFEKVNVHPDIQKLDFIGLRKINPVIYSPNNYFTVGEHIGEIGDYTK